MGGVKDFLFLDGWPIVYLGEGFVEVPYEVKPVKAQDGSNYPYEFVVDILGKS